MLKSSAAPSLNVLISMGQICQSIRSKKLFYQMEEDASEGHKAGPFWCGRSQAAIGPDGQLVSFEDCRPGRACCHTA